MANALYNPYKDQLLSNATAIDMDGDVIKASGIDAADYTFSAAHDEYSGGSRDVALVAIVCESGALGSPTTTWRISRMAGPRSTIRPARPVKMGRSTSQFRYASPVTRIRRTGRRILSRCISLSGGATVPRLRC
jgi:hypothetical protein